MIKLIPVTRLQAGMYVHDLNCGWLQHGFVRNRFLVASADDVRKVREIGVTEIYVDTGRGLDPDALPAPDAAPDAPESAPEPGPQHTAPAPAEDAHVAGSARSGT